MPFSIISLSSGATRVVLEGNLDTFTVDRLRPELLAVARRRPIAVEVDLSRLRSLTTRGKEVLGAFFAVLTQTECRVTVAEARDQPLGHGHPAGADAILDASRLVN
jgi:anti-anti-sigma regulatory factor